MIEDFWNVIQDLEGRSEVWKSAQAWCSKIAYEIFELREIGAFRDF